MTTTMIPTPFFTWTFVKYFQNLQAFQTMKIWTLEEVLMYISYKCSNSQSQCGHFFSR